jgi:hypothetical protein
MGTNNIYLFLDEDNNPTLWRRTGCWAKYMNKTPKEYADSFARVCGKTPDYGPCFWGTTDLEPEELGYLFVGMVVEYNDPT